MLKVEHYHTETAHWLIRQFESFRFTEPLLVEKFIPRPDISLVFHFKDVPQIREEPPVQLEPFFVAPIVSRSIVLDFHGTMDTFVVICKPAVLSRIFGLDLSLLRKHGVELPYNTFYPIWEAMSVLQTAGERIEYFTDFINQTQKTPYCPDEVDLLYDQILEKGSKTLLKDFMHDCCASQRTLERKFIKRIGVNPKTLMRIVRLDYLWTRIQNENAIDFQGLTFDGNYFDQSHFISDFKTIIGETPGFFFNRNQDLAKMFSGRKEGSV